MTRWRAPIAFLALLLAVLFWGSWAPKDALNRTVQVAQLLFFTSAIGVGVFGIWKHFDESSEKQRWERAKLAKQMIDDIGGEPKAMAASYMLGAWDGRLYDRQEDGKTISFAIDNDQLIAVLNPRHVAQSRNEHHVRECFDELLYHLDLCVGAADRLIVDWEELKPMFVTLFAGVKRETLQPLVAYATHSNYFRAASRISELVEAALTGPQRR